MILGELCNFAGTSYASLPSVHSTNMTCSIRFHRGAGRRTFMFNFSSHEVTADSPPHLNRLPWAHYPLLSALYSPPFSLMKNSAFLVGWVVDYVSYVGGALSPSPAQPLNRIFFQLGSTIIALNGLISSSDTMLVDDSSWFLSCTGPQEETIGQITAFQKLFLAPGFLVYIGVLFAISFSIIFYFGPKSVSAFFPNTCSYLTSLFRHGKKSMLWYIAVCSLIGGISVSVTTGLGSAIVTTAMGDNQVGLPVSFWLLIVVDRYPSSLNTGLSISYWYSLPPP